MVAYPCNTTALEARQKDCCGFEASLGYTVRHFVSKKKKAKTKKKKKMVWLTRILILEVFI